MSQTATTYAKPYRPLPIKVLNALPKLRSDRTVFSTKFIISYAQKITGEKQLSHAPLLEPLERLCEAIAEEAKLSQFGRIVQETRLKGLVTNRLRLDALMRKHPEILEQPDPDVLLIAGLARTGTTFLHRVLASDPGARTLPSWEALNPAPWPGEPLGTHKKREKYGESATKTMNWLAPDFAAVHPVAHDQPEEDILLLDLTMISQTAEAVTYVPSYSRWLEMIDHRPAYEYLRDVLKVLQWLRPGKDKSTHWVLKSPHHAEQLAAALDVFPKATTIITHRSPLVTTASCSSLMCHTQGLSTDAPDPEAIARHWLRKSGLMAMNTIEARKADPARKIIDIHYKDLMATPAAQIARIYDAHGGPLTDAGRQAVVEATGKRSGHGARKHAYALSDFGLTETDVRDTFADYMDHYGLSFEEGTAI